MKDPAFARSLEHFYRQTIGGEFGELTPEAIATARKALGAHATMQKTKLVMEKLQALVALMERRGGTMIAEERLAQLNQLVDEITDAELELPEPYRTHLMQQLGTGSVLTMTLKSFAAATRYLSFPGTF
jgi:hypothetical protein